MKDIIKTKTGYLLVSTVELDSFAFMFDSAGLGNDDAVGTNYETMVFKCNEDGDVSDWGELDKANYMTESEAENGHEKMINKYN